MVNIMRKFAFILLILIPVTIAYANPTAQHPTSFAATIVVVIAALCLEIFITIGVLFFSGIAPVPAFFALFLGNICCYLVVLCPLVFYFKLHVVLVEIAVVSVEAAFIKLISLIAIFQSDTFERLKWRYAFLAAVLGNAASYYIGTIMAATGGLS
jgi:hypothetical protein